MRISTCTTAVLAGLSAVLSMQAMADETDSGPGAVEEIIVTALKRETALSATPLAITALQGTFLDDIGARDFNAFFQQAPGLFTQDSGSGRKRYIIRGVNNQGSGLTQATVAQYLDEVPITDNFNQQPDPYLIDIERVEVLRGPQGTLFGARSMSGTVRTITRKPDLNRTETRGTVNLSWTHLGGRNESLEAIANTPVGEKAALRVSAFYSDEEGYIDNVFPGGTFRPVPGQLPPVIINPAPITIGPINEENFTDVLYYGVRGAVRWQPTDDLTIDAMSLWQRGEIDGTPLYDPTTTGDESNGLITVVVGSSGNDDELWINSLTATYTGKAADFTTVAAYTRRNNFALSAAQAAGPLFAGGPGSTTTSGSDTEIWALESRAASTGDGPWQWLLGGYGFMQNRDGRILEYFAFGNAILQNSTFASRIREVAGFGELSYRPTDPLTLTVGARYSHYRNKLDRFFILAPPGGQFQPNAPDPNPPRFRENSSTLKFEADYDVSDDALVYVMAAQGFRPGGFNPNATPGFNAVPTEYTSDSIWSYEVGAKAAWLDRRLSLNGALYRIDWDDIQGEGFAPNPTGPGTLTYTTNISSARIYGLQEDSQARLTQEWHNNMTLNHFFKAELLEPAPAQPGGLMPLPGDDLPFNPTWSFNVGVDYRAPISRDLEAFARLDWAYVGPRITGFRPLTITGAPFSGYFDFKSYDTVNLRAGLASGPWRFSAYVNNLADMRPVTQNRNFAPFPVTLRNTIKPRTIGFSLATGL
ncbi:MAG: TonB-dependent receptor [Rhodospirillaceae bacterium]|nr:TonB-dependent receptor [Rhodospirillaceae bacterium]